MYSQSKEDEIVYNYFKRHFNVTQYGTLLEIGANDGVTFSNSKMLIEKGWAAHLVEPSSVFSELQDLHKGNNKVQLHKCAIDNEDYISVLNESGAHVPHGTDKALVSTLMATERTKWEQRGVNFVDTECACLSWDTFYHSIDSPKFDFISIDAEGYDLLILKQMDLAKIGCKCLCIEYNSDFATAMMFTHYCAQFGLKEIHRNAENILFAI